MTAPKNKGHKKRPRGRPPKESNLTKSKLLNKKYKSNMSLKEIRIVLHDIRFSPLIPEHQRHLLVKEEPKEIQICTYEKVSNNGNDSSDKETTKTESSSHIKSTGKSNKNVDHDFIEFEKKEVDVALGIKKGTVIDNKSFYIGTRARRYETRKRKVSSSTDQAFVTTDTSHPLNFLEVDKKSKKHCRSNCSRIKTSVESSESENISLKSCSGDSIRTDKKRVKLTSGKLEEHDELKNVESSSHSSTSDDKVQIDQSDSLISKDRYVKIKNVPVITTKSRRKYRRRISSSTSEELVQIVQADTTVCTSNEEKEAIQSESPLANCNNESTNNTIDTIVVNQKENAEGVIESINNTIDTILGNQNENAERVDESVNNTINTILVNQKENAEGVIESINNTIDAVLCNQEENAERVNESINNTIDTILVNQKENAERVIESINNTIDAVLCNQEENAKRVNESINNTIDTILGNQEENAKGVDESINNTIDTILVNQKENAEGVIESINNTIGAVLCNQEENAERVNESINNTIDTILANQKENAERVDESINNTIDTILGNQEENAEGVSTLKELTLRKDRCKTKARPRITEELVLLDGNINIISSQYMKEFSPNAQKTTSVEERIYDKRKQTDTKSKRKKLQVGSEALNSPSVKQPIIQSNCDNIESNKNKNIVDRPQTNVHTSILVSDKSTKQRSPSLLNSQPPKHGGENVYRNTSVELHGAPKITVGSLTVENIQKQGQKVNCDTIVRKFIEQIAEIPSSNSGVYDSKISTKTETAKKPSSIESGPIKLNRERGVMSYDEIISDNKDPTKHDSLMHEFKKPTDVRAVHKGTDEQNKIRNVKTISLRKLKRSWNKPDGEKEKTEKADVKDVASKKQQSQILVDSRVQNTKIPIQYNIPEYITLHNEKPSTPPLETNGTDRKSLNPRKEKTVENKFSVAENDYDDCISLFADSLCFSDDDIDESAYYKNNATKDLRKSVWSNDVQCNIVGSSNFDAYVKKNLVDFDKELINVQEESDLRVLLLNKKKQSVEQVEYIPSVKQLPFTLKTNPDVTKNMASGSTMHVFALFKGFCYGHMAGKCFQNRCRYVHNLPVYVNYVYSQNQSDFWNMLQLGIDKKWHYLVTELCSKSLPAMNGQDIFKMFKILYNAGYLTAHIVIAIVTELQNKGIPIYFMLRQLSFIRYTDTKLRLHILQLVENKIPPGQFWNTVKPLVPFIKTNMYFVERILHECIQNHQNYLHIQEVYRDLMSSLAVHELSLISPVLLTNFFRLLQHINAVKAIQGDTSTNVKTIVNAEKNAEQDAEKKVETESLISKSSVNITSKESTSSSPSEDNAYRTRRNMGIPLSIKSDHNESIARCFDVRNSENSVKNAQSEQSFKLQHIDDPPPPESKSRGTFSKFYEDLNGLKVGLEDRNYDYVVDILSTAASTDNMSFYTDSCYQILQGEIMHSEEHLRKLIKLTVCRRMYPILYDILQDVVMRIIIDLADKEAWVLAYRLLKLAEKYILQFDAAFVLLSAEIYLANRRPLGALGLLRYHNLIYTNRSKWRVRSRRKNDNHRVGVMNILLETLSRESPMYASSLFEFLCVDQSNNSYHPIDLTRHVDRIMTMLLLTGSDESIVSMGRVILEFSIPLRPLTFRATIATLVHRDEILARQMYQYAIRLGVYTTAQFSGIVTFTINMAWTEEEMYLAISELIDRLSKDIGPAIEHLKASDIRIFLNMETIPTDRELSSDEDRGNFYNHLNRNGCTMLQRILARRFDPPLRVTKRGKYCRMITRSIMDYLKAHYCN